MADTELRVLLTMKDELSAKLKSVNAQLKGTQKVIEDSSISLKTMGSNIQRSGMNIAFLGAGILAPFTLALKDATKYSADLSAQFERIGNIGTQLNIKIGSILTPIIEKLANVVEKIYSAFINLDPELQRIIIQIAFLSGIFLVLYGTTQSLAGRLVKVADSIISIGKAALTLAAGHPYILAFTLAGAALVLTWEQTRNYLSPILTDIEVGFKGLVAIMLKVASGFALFAQYMPGFSMFKTQLDEARVVLDGAAKLIDDEIAKLAISGKGSDVVSFLDDLKNKGAELRGIFENLFGGTFTLPVFDTTQINNFIAEMKTALDAVNNIGKQSADILLKSVDTMSKGIGNAFAQMIVTGKKFKESMAELMKTLAIDIIAEMTAMLVKWVAFQIMQMLTVTASSVSQAAVIASAWAAAAANVSLASYGANAAPAMAGISATHALTAGLSAVKLAEGGIVTRPTLALIGERGREAVIPLNNNTNSVANKGISVNIENASFASDADVTDIFLTLSNLIENRRRALV